MRSYAFCVNVVVAQKWCAYSTGDSQAVSDPSTNPARRCLTCQIGRDGVCSTWYGRKRLSYEQGPLCLQAINYPFPFCKEFGTYKFLTVSFLSNIVSLINGQFPFLTLSVYVVVSGLWNLFIIATHLRTFLPVDFRIQNVFLDLAVINVVIPSAHSVAIFY